MTSDIFARNNESKRAAREARATKKAIGLAFALTAASVVSQMAKGDELEQPPHVTLPSNLKMTQPLILQKSNDSAGVTATLIMDCSVPKTYVTVKGVNGSSENYAFDKEGKPTIDATPPTGVSATPEIKKEVVQRLMRELGQRQLNDFSPANLCRDGKPNAGAGMAILNFIIASPREFDI